MVRTLEVTPLSSVAPVKVGCICCLFHCSTPSLASARPLPHRVGFPTGSEHTNERANICRAQIPGRITWGKAQFTLHGSSLRSPAGTRPTHGRFVWLERRRAHDLSYGRIGTYSEFTCCAGETERDRESYDL